MAEALSRVVPDSNRGMTYQFAVNTCFHAQYQRLAGKRGKKRALIAVAHSILGVAYVLLKEYREYQDLGADYFERANRESVTKYHVKKLQKLGYDVSLAVTTPA